MNPFHIGAGLASVAASICCLALFAGPAQAEYEAEIYGGVTLTDDSPVFNTPSSGSPTTSFREVDHDKSGTVGGKFGYWFADSSRAMGAFGIGLDVFHFNPDAGSQTVQTLVDPIAVPTPNFASSNLSSIDISTVAIAFDVLRYRFHLYKSEEFKRGRVQPYFSAGPVLMITSISDTNMTPNSQSSTDLSVGVKLSGGVKYYVTSALSVFGEFRFTHYRAEGTFRDSGTEVNQSMHLTSQHFVGGIAVHF